MVESNWPCGRRPPRCWTDDIVDWCGCSLPEAIKPVKTCCRNRRGSPVLTWPIIPLTHAELLKNLVQETLSWADNKYDGECQPKRQPINKTSLSSHIWSCACTFLAWNKAAFCSMFYCVHLQVPCTWFLNVCQGYKLYHITWINCSEVHSILIESESTVLKKLCLHTHYESCLHA